MQDRRNIEAASKAATLQNQQQVARIEANAAAITEKAKDDFEADRAHLRTELANRLRTETKANSGRSYADRAGLVPNASGKPDGQAVSLPADELLLAAETELQLKALQDWIEVQAKVQR